MQIAGMIFQTHSRTLISYYLFSPRIYCFRKS
ncbi:MAG: DUF6783 domain-containing protein [Lachnospiraceae bacterium]|nr:DUF6783 domain-containing protein [Lachnospiraceae bacterium]